MEVQKRILFIAAHRPDRSPSQRFRFEQYFSYLQSHGYDYDFSYLISEEDDRIFYQPGNLRTKIYIFFKSVWKRWKDVLRAENYDIVFIQREAFMTGSTFFEKRFKKSGAKMIFDFDDAIWHLDVSEGNKKFSWLKNPGKTARIIDMADLTIAGNRYLADYAKHHSDHVVIIPTTIDTGHHRKTGFKKNDDRLCIGWTGSITTIKHFEHAVPFLLKIKERYRDKIYFKVIGDETYSNEKLGVKAIAWKKETEISDLAEIDIGIMPLPDDEWSKGKCGLKGLSYMAMEIPTVMSAVGVNKEIITDGVNGFLAAGDEEWLLKLSLLIEDAALREKIGKAGRQTVIDKYSVSSQQENYLRHFNELLETHKHINEFLKEAI